MCSGFLWSALPATRGSREGRSKWRRSVRWLTPSRPRVSSSPCSFGGRARGFSSSPASDGGERRKLQDSRKSQQFSERSQRPRPSRFRSSKTSSGRTSTLEEAEGYLRLVDEFGLTQEEVSARVGKDRSTVANGLRLLGLPESVKTLLRSGALSMGHARALLGAAEAERVGLAERVASTGLSVRETEQLVRARRRTSPKSGKARKAAPSAAARTLVEELQRALGTKVRLEDRGGAGTLAIDFFSYADLERIVRLLRR